MNSFFLPMKQLQSIYPNVIAFVMALLLYGVWVQYFYSSDDLQYATVIEQSVTGKLFYHPAGDRPFVAQPDSTIVSTKSKMPINPRYLLEWPTSILIAKLWHLAGWTGDSIIPILRWRSLIGALGILFIFMAIRKLTGDIGIATLGSAGIATSAAYWTYSTHLDQTINMIALISLAFYLLVLRDNSSHSNLFEWLIVFVLALATLYNFTAALLALVFDWTISSTRPEPKAKMSQFLKFGFAYGVLVVIFLALGIAVLSAPSDLISLEYWKSVTFQGHQEYLFEPLGDAVRSVMGFAKGQMDYPGAAGSLRGYWNNANTSARIILIGFYGMMLTLMIVPLGILIGHYSQLKHQSIVQASAIWLIVYTAFNWWWDPGYIKYWIIPLLGWWVLAALALNHVKRAISQWCRPTLGAIMLLCLLGFVVNTISQFLPQSNEHANDWLITAQSLRQSSPNSLFISAGHPLDFYITFFADRDVVATGLVSYDTGGDEEKVRRVVRSHIEQHRSMGGSIYVYGVNTMTENERQQFLNLLSAQQLGPAQTWSQIEINEIIFAK